MNIPIRGRPRDLSFRQRLAVVLAWDAAHHALARRNEIAEELGRRFRVMAKQMARLQASGASVAKIAQLSAKMDRIGRYRTFVVSKPKELKPEIDRRVAEQHGITERMVQKCRDDPRMLPFRSAPPWKVPEWEAAALQEAAARQLARRLMTPERLAKGEPVRIFNGGLCVPDQMRRHSILRFIRGRWARVYFDDFEYVSDLEREIIPGPAPRGARCSFMSTLPRAPTDREAKAQRAIRAFKAKVTEWKKSLE